MHLAERFYVNAVSVAVGGSKARDVLESQVDEALEHEPDIAYVVVGSNDALRGTPVARFEEEFDSVVAKLHADVPSVGLSGIGDLGTIPRLPHLARGIARIRFRQTRGCPPGQDSRAQPECLAVPDRARDSWSPGAGQPYWLGMHKSRQVN